MEFSKRLRQRTCVGLRKLYALDTADQQQVTYLMKGDMPSFDALNATMQTEWAQRNISPNSVSSSLNANMLGTVSGLLGQFTWTDATEDRPVMPYESNTDFNLAILTTRPLVVGMSGTKNPSTFDVVYDHATKGAQQVTWMLTVWHSNSAIARSRYVVHRVGVEFDPNAELVLKSTTLLSDNPTLEVIEFINPIY